MLIKINSYTTDDLYCKRNYLMKSLISDDIYLTILK